MDRLAADLRVAIRGFRRTPAFFVTAAVILSLGIGLSVAMFSVFRTVLIRRLPVTDQDRIAVMWTWRDDPKVEFAAGAKDLADFRRRGKTIQDVAAVAHWPAIAGPLIDGERTVALNRGMATGNFFNVLGVRPALGRLFEARDDDVGAAWDPTGAHSSRVLVLSYSAWQTEFGGDSSIIGHRLIEPLSRWEYRVIGVAPPGFSYPSGVKYWIPMWQGWQGGVSSFAVARVKPGLPLSAARDEYLVNQRAVRPDVAFGGANVATFTQAVLGNVTPVLYTLTAAVALLLLIACINVGNLLLLRASGRGREIAVRRAIGASYGDIVRQLFVEAFAIAVVGGIGGLLVAVTMIRSLIAFAPANLPRLDAVRLSGAPVLVAVATSGIAVLLFGMLPALFAARTKLAAPLRSDARSGEETHRRRLLRQALVGSQIALAMIMFGGAALLARSLARLERQDLGLTSDHLAILHYTWNARRYGTLGKMIELGSQIDDRLRAIPGVAAATPILMPPLLGMNVWHGRMQREGESAEEANRNPGVVWEVAGPDYFKTFGIPIVRGRGFSDDLQTSGPYEAVISESMARQYWPGEDPIGKRINNPFLPIDSIAVAGNATVVGVVPDAHLRSVRETAPTVFFPSSQSYWQGYFAIRTNVDVAALQQALRAAGRDVDPDAILWRAQTMDEVLDEPLAQPRLGTLLMSSFGIVALLLAAIGLYGVMASLVRDQVREIGIRVALGAAPGDIRRDILARAAKVTAIGIVVGLFAALGTSHLLTSLLYEVSPADPVALGGACLVLLGAGAVAAYLPARRATQIDPVQALRTD